MSTGLPTTADRVVAVLSDARQGSGVVVSPWLVLTCAHNLVGPAPVRLAHPAIGEVGARVLWRDERVDAALLYSDEELLPGMLRLGSVDTAQSLPGCEIIGFPDIQRYGADHHLDYDQFVGTVLPVAGSLRDDLVCELHRPPAAERADGSSPLAGLSGAPLFAGATLLGLVKEIPRGRGHRRVVCVPLRSVHAMEGFRAAFATLAAVTGLELVTGVPPEDQRYEQEYAEAIGAAYRKTKIFGLDELNKRDSEWDLDTAYLSLEARPKAAEPPQAGRSLTDSAPQRIDALLASRPRVLIRGEAGAGKTTLVWWLAAHAAAGRLGPGLADLNALVPFVVPLRSLRAQGATFPLPAQLPTAARLVVDAAPDGWAGRVLKTGRALLLVDGLDEVPQEDREEAHRWLAALLDRYPRTRCVVTVRPMAVEPDWLKYAGFEELRLLPMNDEDITAFIAAWHRAARLDSGPHEDLDELERDLSEQFKQNSNLKGLARTPLLCAVICALHRLRQGFLPDTRWQLYEAALRMLLGNRDQQRKVPAAEGIAIGAEECTELLQRIAVWLVREGQSEFTREQALRRLERALRGMENVRAQGTADDVLRHLLNRSGLLQERADNVFQFTHRTFQDFLAAKEFVDDGHLGELLRHAPEEQQWQDVILLAAGHCGRRDRAALVNGLLDAAARQRGHQDRAKIEVLAARCAQNTAYFDEDTHRRVGEHIKALLPPRDLETVTLLARLGPSVLKHLPDPADTPREALGDVVALINRVGGAEAIEHAGAWAAAHPGTVDLFATEWSRYPAERYAREVLARLDLREARLHVETRWQLAQLPHVPGARRLWITVPPDLTAAELHRALRGRTVTALRLNSTDRLTDLAFLRDSAEWLEDLEVLRGSGLRDLSQLGRLPRLASLGLLDVAAQEVDLAPLGSAAALRTLLFGSSTDLHLAQLPVLPGVTTLHLEADQVAGFDALSHWPALGHLELAPSSSATTRRLLAYVRGRPGIGRLGVALSSVAALAGVAPLPGVRHLDLWLANSDGDLGAVLAVFPALTTVDLAVGTVQAGSWNPAALLRRPGLTVTVNGGPLAP
ncbi:NACHT domain-containing protein [Streptomyces sp. NBC_00083]|uniref:NACHT domain-containing protein n=1 Tax=Streptomyces sp. NBC_00083 TaxID=2975647 RepID=UPI00224CA82A|nr:NACHT domain-containing protein [Streptomyces sp. NBC_00083]MCX5387986.1 NACHT domain-containing protein [Streptomyces sp. NBC_00083]